MSDTFMSVACVSVCSLPDTPNEDSLELIRHTVGSSVLIVEVQLDLGVFCWAQFVVRFQNTQKNHVYGFLPFSGLDLAEKKFHVKTCKSGVIGISKDSFDCFDVILWLEHRRSFFVFLRSSSKALLHSCILPVLCHCIEVATVQVLPSFRS